MVDYYKTLNISKSATDEEVKKAYKSLAKTHHPDTGGDASTFRQISEAYQVLSDPTKRKNYDTYGSAEAGQFNFRTSNAQDINVDEIFNQFGMHFGKGFQQKRQLRNKDVRIQYAVDFKDVFKGKTEDVTFQLPSGSVEVIRMNIPAGIKNQDKIQFTGYGDDAIRNAPRGNLIVIVTVNPDPKYRVEGIDIYTTLNVEFWDLIFGLERIMYLPDSSSINLKVPAGTNPNTLLSVNNHGVPDINTGKRGRLFVEVRANTPSLDKKQFKALQEYHGRFIVDDV
jgi:curved DNA-binding protein